MAKGKASAPAVNDALRTEIARLLLSGMPARQVIARIASRGVPGGLAEAEVTRAERSPYLAGADRLQGQATKLGWVLANQTKLAAGPVPRLSGLSPQAFHDGFWRANRPVVLSGLIDHWPARTWSFAALSARLGAALVEVQDNREADRDYEIAKDRHATRLPLASIIARITEGGSSNDFYVTAYNNRHNRAALAPLWADFGSLPGWLAGEGGFVWMGPQGTITPFHHDLTNNLLVQLVGSKRVKLVPPGATPMMRNHLHCFSQWRGEELPAGPGDETRPPVEEVEIGPGDALFLPVGWWHHVEGLAPHIGLSFTNFVWDNDFYSHYRSGSEPLWA
jgi:hypothetical protein